MSHKDLVKELRISSKTLIKYKDSGKVFRDKYIISSVKSLSYNGFEDLYIKRDVNNIRCKTDKNFGKASAIRDQYDIITLSSSFLSGNLNKKEN